MLWWLIFSGDLLSLYPPVYFMSKWLRVFIAFTNNNGDCASPWNIPLGFLLQLCFSLLLSIQLSIFSLFFSLRLMISSYILYILKLFIFQFWGTILYAFLLSINAINKYFCLVLLSLRMRWSVWSSSPVRLTTLRHRICSSGNSPRFISKSKISSLVFAVRIFNIIGKHIRGL